MAEIPISNLPSASGLGGTEDVPIVQGGVTSRTTTQAIADLATAGSGNVNAGGTLTSNAVVLGAGTTNVQTVAGLTTDGVSKLTLGVAASSVGSIAFANLTSGSITLSPVTGALGAVTLSLPAATDTLIGKATTDTLTNKTFDTAGTGNSFKINGTSITAVTGSGSVVLATSPTIATPILNGTPTGTGVDTAATMSTLVLRDANANISANNTLFGYTTTATAGGTTTLTAASTYWQFFTGTSAQTVQLPVTSTLALGFAFGIVNLSTFPVTVNSSGGNLVLTVPPGATGRVSCILTSGTTAASWASSYQVAGQREVLSANRTYYVRTDGSDSNNGLENTSAGAFLTLQKACDVVFGTLDLGGKNVTIQVGDGTYTAGVSQTAPQVGAGTVTFQGNTTTPSNCIISVTNASCFAATNGGVQFIVDGFKLATATSGNCVEANNGATVTIGSNMEFGTCATRQVVATRAGIIQVNSGYAISGGAAAHFWAEQGGIIFSNADTFVLSNTPAFTTAFVSAKTGGNIRVTSATFSGTGATGSRFAASNGGIIDTGGGGASYFPGNAGGTGTNFSASPYGMYI